MTGNTIELLNRLNSEELSGKSDVYDLYQRSLAAVDKLEEIFKLMKDIEPKAYNFPYLKTEAEILNIKRKDLVEVLLGLLELLGNNVEKLLKDDGPVVVKNDGYGFTTDYIMFAASDNFELANAALQRSSLGRGLTLGECKKAQSEWFFAYIFELEEI